MAGGGLEMWLADPDRADAAARARSRRPAGAARSSPRGRRTTATSSPLCAGRRSRSASCCRWCWASGAFEVASALVVLVTEKRREFGVLLALGGQPRLLRRTLLLAGGALGAAGVLAGMLLGVAVVLCWGSSACRTFRRTSPASTWSRRSRSGCCRAISRWCLPSAWSRSCWRRCCPRTGRPGANRSRCCVGSERRRPLGGPVAPGGRRQVPTPGAHPSRAAARRSSPSRCVLLVVLGDRGRPSARAEGLSHLVHGGRRPAREPGAAPPGRVAAREGARAWPDDSTSACSARGGWRGSSAPGRRRGRSRARRPRPAARATRSPFGGWREQGARLDALGEVLSAPLDALRCPLSSLPIASPVDVARAVPVALFGWRVSPFTGKTMAQYGVTLAAPQGEPVAGAGCRQGGVRGERAGAEGQRVDALRQPRRRGPRRRGGDDLRAPARHAGETRPGRDSRPASRLGRSDRLDPCPRALLRGPVARGRREPAHRPRTGHADGAGRGPGRAPGRPDRRAPGGFALCSTWWGAANDLLPRPTPGADPSHRGRADRRAPVHHGRARATGKERRRAERSRVSGSFSPFDLPAVLPVPDGGDRLHKRRAGAGRSWMTETTLKRTPLYECHVEAKARIVPVRRVRDAGAVRGRDRGAPGGAHRRSGLFDVSHMGEIEVMGRRALDFVQYVTCNDASKLTAGRAQYSGLMTPRGTFVDDLLVHKIVGRSLLPGGQRVEHGQGLRLPVRPGRRLRRRGRSQPVRRLRADRGPGAAGARGAAEADARRA